MDNINLTSYLDSQNNNQNQDNSNQITYCQEDDFIDDDTNFAFYYSSPYLLVEEDEIPYQEQFKITVDTNNLVLYLDEIRTLNTSESEDEEDEVDDILIQRLVEIPYQEGLRKIKNNIDLRTNINLRTDDKKSETLSELYSEIKELLNIN